MRKGFLGSVAGVLAGASLIFAQSPSPPGGPAALSPVTPVYGGEGTSPYMPGPAALHAGLEAHGPIPGGCPSCMNAEPAGSPYLPGPVPPVTDNGCGCKPLALPAEPCHPLALTITGGLEYLNWWAKQGRLNTPLVTTGPLLSRGVLGDPGTRVLFGDQNLDYHDFSGGRILLDFWHDASRTQGVEMNIFALGTKGVNFRAASDPNGFQTLAIPFADAITGQERSALISFPGAFAGGVAIQAKSDLWGAEGNLLAKAPLFESRSLMVWGLAGFRYLDLGESLSIGSQSTLLPGGLATLPDGTTQVLQGGSANFGNVGPIFAPSQIAVRDLFQTRDQFYGGQIGFRAEAQWGEAFVVLTGKVGLGGTEETLKISGVTAVSPGGPPNTTQGGLFAVGTNSGRNTHNSFAVIPEGGIQVGFYLFKHLRTFIGYDYLYWSNVIRPEEQIDRVINRLQVPSSNLFGTLTGPSRPGMGFRESDYWTHGLSIGFDYTY